MKDIKLTLRALVAEYTGLPVHIFVERVPDGDFIVLELIGGQGDRIKIDRAVLNVNHYYTSLERAAEIEGILRKKLLRPAQFVDGSLIVTSIWELHRPIPAFDQRLRRRFTEWGIEVAYNRDC